MHGVPLSIIIVPPPTKSGSSGGRKSDKIGSSQRVENIAVANDCAEERKGKTNVLAKVYRIFDFTVFKDIMVAMLVLMKLLFNMGYINIYKLKVGLIQLLLQL